MRYVLVKERSLSLSLSEGLYELNSRVHIAQKRGMHRKGLRLSCSSRVKKWSHQGPPVARCLRFTGIETRTHGSRAVIKKSSSLDISTCRQHERKWPFDAALDAARLATTSGKRRCGIVLTVTRHLLNYTLAPANVAVAHFVLNSVPTPKACTT